MIVIAIQTMNSQKNQEAKRISRKPQQLQSDDLVLEVTKILMAALVANLKNFWKAQVDQDQKVFQEENPQRMRFPVVVIPSKIVLQCFQMHQVMIMPHDAANPLAGHSRSQLSMKQLQSKLQQLLVHSTCLMTCHPQSV